MPLSHVQPERYAELLNEKAGRVSTLLAPFAPPRATVIASPPTAFRMRAEFRLWHDGDALNYVMFRPGDRKTPVVVEYFPIGCEHIQQLMPALLERLQVNPVLRHKVFQAEFLSSLAGDSLLTLVYHRPLDDAWQREAEALAAQLGVSVVGRSRKQKITIGRDYIFEELPVHGRNYRYRQYEQAFTQPNARVNIAMIEWACDQAASLDSDLLELYCGNGNFTLPLSRQFNQVIATELSKTSVRAARENIADNAIDNIQMVRLSAREVSEAIEGTRVFRRLEGLPQRLGDYALHTLFVDPPRAGLDVQTVNMAAGFEHIIYISCNPESLVSNLKTLTSTHDIRAFAQFDQFPYTTHMECGVLLVRR